VVGIAAVSTASIFIRYAQREAPSLVIAAYRLGIATLLLTPLALSRHRDELRQVTRRELGLALLSGAFLGAHFASWVSSLDYTSVMVSVVLVTTSPLWVALASPFLLRERVRIPMLAGLALALGGGVLIAVGAGGDSTETQLVGNLLALGGAWAVTAYWIIGRNLRARLSVIPYTWLVYGTAAVALWATVLIARLPVTGYSAETYTWFALLAAVPQLVGHSSFNYALAHLSAVYVSVATLGEPVGSTVLAMILLGEVPTLVQGVGGVLILAGILLASRVERPASLEADAAL
jgi:drug/metabolite transporter (DMT)-like permease